MDFFEAQDAARRRTGVLIALFAAAVIAIIAVVYAVVRVSLAPGPELIDPVLLGMVALGVGALVGIGSAVRTASLRQGGPAVAEMMGARRISPDTDDPEERKLVNVVEEMAIASGTPVPAIYVMDREEGINAFAAGYATHDAAVAVTRGALQTLTRTELQGVIAHEFSHILNGDMRLNIRLIGVLYGILLLAVVGRGIVYGSRGGRRGRDGNWIVLLGLALLLVGYVGVFFGKLIKAAVSRQREYLADSAAVQFTRDPEALAGALKKIGAQAQGSRIQDHHAEELSHLFFANGLRRSMFGALSTHPPLEERIRRLDPAWTGEYGAGEPGQGGRPAAREHAAAAARHGFGGTTAPAAAAGLAGPVRAASPAGAVASIGSPTPEHLAYAASLLRRIPEPLKHAAHDPAAARALVFALLLEGSQDGEAEARALLERFGGDELVAEVDGLLPRIREQGPEARLPLLDLAMPALLQMPPAEAERFRDTVDSLIRVDGRLRPFEYALSHTLARRMQARSGTADRGGRRIRSLDPLREQVEVLLSAVAWAGSDGDADAAAAAFTAGLRRLPSSLSTMRLLALESVDLGRVDRALGELEHAAAPAQRLFLEACADTAAFDRRLEPEEAELLRAIAESLDCPMPPLLQPA